MNKIFPSLDHSNLLHLYPNVSKFLQSAASLLGSTNCEKQYQCGRHWLLLDKCFSWRNCEIIGNNLKDFVFFATNHTYPTCFQTAIYFCFWFLDSLPNPQLSRIDGGSFHIKISCTASLL